MPNFEISETYYVCWRHKLILQKLNFQGSLFGSKYRVWKNLRMVSSKQLSLNEDKTRFTLFHKLQDRDNLPLQLPVLKIDNCKIKRSSSIKFLGVMVDEYLDWKDHISIIENKLSKYLGLLHKAKQFLNANATQKFIFHPFIDIWPMEMLHGAVLPWTKLKSYPGNKKKQQK